MSPGPTADSSVTGVSRRYFGDKTLKFPDFASSIRCLVRVPLSGQKCLLGRLWSCSRRQDAGLRTESQRWRTRPCSGLSSSLGFRRTWLLLFVPVGMQFLPAWESGSRPVFAAVCVPLRRMRGLAGSSRLRGNTREPLGTFLKV